MNSLFKKLPLVLLLLLLCVPGAVASTVVRTITGKNTATPMVVITATPDASVSAYAVQDQLPLGLTPANITQGGVWDGVNRMVKWGPFDTNITALTLSYTATGSPGTYTVSGVGSFDGVSVPTTGDSQIVITAASTVVCTVTGGTNVCLVATPAATVSSYAVQESLPTGLTPSNITQGGTWDAANREVKWGPWFDTTARTLCFTVTGSPGTYSLTGVGSFDGVSVPTPGECQIVIPPPWLPYVPTAAQTSIAVLETNGAWQASVTIYLENTCQKLVGWGGVSLTGDTFVADAEFDQAPPGTVCAQIVTIVSYNYDLGALSPGSYLFVFQSWGTEVAQQAFVVTSSSSVVRTILNGTNVSLVATPAASVSSYAVEESLPASLTPANITQGGTWDAANRAVKWGPWFDTTARTLTYTVTGSLGIYTVSGVGSFDGVSVPTTGDSQIVNPPTLPVITNAPQSQVAFAGSNVIFTVGATGLAPLQYEWRFNNVQIAGATNSSYTVSSAKISDQGMYGASAFNGVGLTDATNFELVVLLPPINATAGVGASATFTVVETNAPPLSFQWSFDGNAISGATNTNYTAADLQFTNQGIYTVVVTGLGAPASASATLTVTNPAPSTVVRTIAAGTNVTVVATPAANVSSYAVEEDLPAGLTAANISPGGVWDAVNRMVKWGPFDTNITTLTLSYTVTGDQGTYTVSGVGSFDGVSVTTTGDSQIVIPPSRLIFTLQPVSEVVSLGQGVTFTAAATGSPPPTYQWQFDGTDISGATGASYNIPSAGLGNIGLYDVVIANSAGNNVSSNVSLGFLDLKLLAAVYLTGPIGSTYDIEAASALAPTDWITVTNVTITTQPFIWVDYSSATNAEQFYRAVPQ